MNLRQSLFWDVDPKTLSWPRHRRYITTRILQFGTEKDIRWLFKKTSRRQLRTVVKTSRVLDAKSKTLWMLLTK